VVGVPPFRLPASTAPVSHATAPLITRSTPWPSPARRCASPTSRLPATTTPHTRCNC
jgi:hypothetical protein